MIDIGRKSARAFVTFGTFLCLFPLLWYSGTCYGHVEKLCYCSGTVELAMHMS